MLAQEKSLTRVALLQATEQELNKIVIATSVLIRFVGSFLNLYPVGSEAAESPTLSQHRLYLFVKGELPFKVTLLDCLLDLLVSDHCSSFPAEFLVPANRICQMGCLAEPGLVHQQALGRLG